MTQTFISVAILLFDIYYPGKNPKEILVYVRLRKVYHTYQ